MKESQSGPPIEKALRLVDTYKRQMMDLTTIIGAERKRAVLQHLVNAGGQQSKVKQVRVAEFQDKV